MITKEELKEIGWRHVGASRDGGTTLWQFGERYALKYYGTNQILKQENNSRLNYCVIEKVEDNLSLTKLMECHIENKKELLQEMNKIGIIK